MTIAKKSIVWGLFAAGGTLSSFLFPVIILLFLLLSAGIVPDGLQYDEIHIFAASWLGKFVLFMVIFLSLVHAVYRLHLVFHDLGLRRSKEAGYAVYLAATIITLMAAFYLFSIK